MADIDEMGSKGGVARDNGKCLRENGEEKNRGVERRRVSRKRKVG